MAPDIQERGKRKRVLIGAEYTSKQTQIVFLQLDFIAGKHYSLYLWVGSLYEIWTDSMLGLN